MGVIFRAHDKKLDKEVSIKALPTRAQVGSKRIVRFQKEARAAGRLSHPNIVQVLDFGVTKSGDPYLVMDYIKGVSLEQHISDSGSLEVGQALLLFIQIVDGLSHAHNNGIVHRDIKSSNIMLETSDPEKPVAKIVDFGVAHMRVAEIDRSGFDSTGNNLVGSPGYMGPEIIDGKKADQRSDIYALGCLMFETIVGRLPFHGNTAIDTITKHKQCPVPNITQSNIKTVNPQLAQAMGEIIEICMSKNPDDRFQDAEELKLDLVECASIFDREIRDAVNQIEIDRKNFFQSMIRPFNASRVPVFAMLFLCVLVLSSAIAFQLLVPTWKLLFPTWNLQLQDSTSVSSRSGKKQKKKKSRPTSFLGNKNILSSTDRQITDKAMREGKLEPTRKRELNVRGGELTDASIAIMAKMKLTSLDLSQNNITDEGLKEIATWTQLTSLELDWIKSISDNGIEAIAQLPNLNHLSLGGTDITDEALRSLTKTKQLGVLSLPLCNRITSNGVRQLKAVPYLSRINIGWTNVSTSAFNSFPCLNHIQLAASKPFSKEDMAALAAVPSLDTITVLKGTLSPDVLRELVKCKKLRYLKLEFVEGLKPEDVDRFENYYKKTNHVPISIESFIE